MAMTLDELTKSLKNSTYTPLTEDQIKQQAQNKYQSELEQNLLTAQQAYDTSALALDDQRAKLDASYAKQEETARKNTAKTYSAADRQALSRGMQRSSYNNQTLANINAQGDETLNRLAESLRADQNTLDSQKAQAAQQLAQQIAQYQKANQSQVAAYADQLREQNYQRQTEQDKYYNQLQAMLYEYGLQEAKTSGGSGGGRSSGGGTNNSKTNIVNPAGGASASTSAFLDALNGGSLNAAMVQYLRDKPKMLTFDSGERFTATVKPNVIGAKGGVTITNLTKAQAGKMQKNPVNPKMGVFSPTLTITRQNMAKGGKR